MLEEIRRRSDELAEVDPDFKAILGRSLDQDRFMELAGKVAKPLTGQPQIRVPSSPQAADDPSASDLLVQAAARQARQAQQVPIGRANGPGESSTRIESVELEGFRGAPLRLNVNFTLSKSPVSAVLFGENGVGKSTIVDAVEFGLQGRVGRSANFDSAIAPAVRSISPTVAKSKTRVKLSDGSVVEREASVTQDKRVVADPRSVREEFRLAPITIKRSDILRFLDTEALERGTALLDYFPADAGEIAMRPEEEIHQLQGEMTELRIRRSAYAADLADLLGEEKSALGTRDF